MSTRMSVTFTEPQMKWLKKQAKRLGITAGEAIRRFIDERRGVIVSDDAQIVRVDLDSPEIGGRYDED